MAENKQPVKGIAAFDRLIVECADKDAIREQVWKAIKYQIERQVEIESSESSFLRHLVRAEVKSVIESAEFSDMIDALVAERMKAFMAGMTKLIKTPRKRG